MIFLTAFWIAVAVAAGVMTIVLVIDFVKQELELRRSRRRMDAFNHSHSL